MVSANTIAHDFKLLDGDLVSLEHHAKELVHDADKSGEDNMKDFVNSIRKVYQMRNALFLHTSKSQNSVLVRSSNENKAEDKLIRELAYIRQGKKFSPIDFANMLEASLDNFETLLGIQIRYQPGMENLFVQTRSHINRRKMLMEDMKRTFDGKQFDSVMSSGSLSILRSKLKVLAEARYDDLYSSIERLEKLMAEFNTSFHNIYVATSELDMIKGVNMEPAGFIGKLFGQGKMTILPDLTRKDKIKISAIQGWVHRLHEVTVKAIRERQQEVIRELRQIKQDEAELRSTFKKGFGRGDQRITRMAA